MQIQIPQHIKEEHPGRADSIKTEEHSPTVLIMRGRDRPENTQLPSIRDLFPEIPEIGSRRSSTTSVDCSIISSFCGTPDPVSPGYSPHYSPYPSRHSSPGRPSQRKPRSTRGVTASSTHNAVKKDPAAMTKEEKEREIKAQREKMARKGSSYCFSDLMMELEANNPNIMSEALNRLGTTGLRTLKINNINKEIREKEPGRTPLLCNKDDATHVATTMLCQDRQLFQMVVSLLQTLGHTELAQEFARAVATRGTAEFSYPTLPPTSSRL